MLAYGRNDGKGLSYHELRGTEKQVSMLELQFTSFRHKFRRPGEQLDEAVRRQPCVSQTLVLAKQTSYSYLFIDIVCWGCAWVWNLICMTLPRFRRSLS